MTKTLPYIRERDGVFQYERRVPQHVQHDADWFAAKFGNRPLFRRSLRTKRRAEAALAYEAVDREFEARLVRPGSTPRFAQVSRTAPSRVLTNHDLDAIAERYCRVTAAPIEKLHRRANVDPAAAAELARTMSDLDYDGEAIMAALRSPDGDPDAPCLHPRTEAALVITEHNFAAPEGSEERGAIIAAPGFRRELSEYERYRREFSGRKKGRRGAAIDYLSYHGDVVEALCLERTASAKAGEKVYNSQLIDLYIRASGVVTEVYEVKTRCERQSVYTAIGQLITHAPTTAIKRVMVLPQGAIDADLMAALRTTGITLRRFSLTGPRPRVSLE